MITLRRLLLALLCLSACVWPGAVTPLAAAAGRVTAATPSAPLVPLPKSCGGGLPAGDSAPACCMFGYVFIDGQPVDGAKVTITSDHGRIEEWTSTGPDSTQPYFRTSLSDPPLRAQTGETVTVVAEYSGHQHTITHRVLGGGQQVDVVLPRNRADDFVADRQIWRQSEPGTFNQLGSIAIDATNTVYVVDSNNARVQVFDSNGQFLRQWGTQGGAVGSLAHPAGIWADRLGSVYVVDGSNFRIQKFSNTGDWQGAWGSYGSENGQFNGINQISADPSGNIYVADTWNSRIQKFSKNGTWIANIGSYGDGNGQLIYPQGVGIDKNGAIYVADWWNHRVQKFNNDGVWLETWGGRGASDGQFELPSGIAIDSSNNVYVADGGNCRIQKFSSDGRWLASRGSCGSGEGQMSISIAIAVDTTSDVYISDAFNNRIQKLSGSGDWIGVWGHLGAMPGQFDYPEGVATDKDGNIYVPNNPNKGKVQKFRADGTWTESWGDRGGSAGRFDNPRKVAIDSNNNVFVADAGNARVQKFRADGTWLTSWGVPGSSKGQFNTTSFGMGIGIDRNGNVYVADTGNSRIQKFTNNGVWLASWGSDGYDNGQFHLPRGVVVNSSGYVFVADTENNRIQKFTSAGDWIASWGSFGDGEGQFRHVSGISVDAFDNVYVSDLWNSRIQKFTDTGIYITSWGAPGGGDGQFDRPEGLYISLQGLLYVADSGNSRIQILRPMTYSRPIATIVSATPRSVVQGQAVELIGMGGDSDTTSALAGYEWTLDGATTPFATTSNASFPTTTIAPGRHTISFRVRDTEGEWSDAQSTTVDVSARSGTTHETWTFLLYLAGDNSNTALYMNRNTRLGALYRLEHTPVNPNVRVVALYDGDYPGGGDSFRYTQQPDGQLRQETLGEVNMGDPQTLVDFVRWGQQQAPADHYYLAIADHANALDGIAWDFTTARTEHLTNGELRQALGAITDQGARSIDVLHLDGCLMGLVENAYQVRGLVRYLVASENLGWSAFAYDQYLTTVRTNTSPATLASSVADEYAQRVGGQGYPFTIAALNLANIDAVAQATDALAGELLRFALASSANRDLLINLRSQAQKFDSGGNYTVTEDDEYVDLQHWVSLVQAGIGDASVKQAATALQQTLPGAVLREHHASGNIALDTNVSVNLEQAHGIAIYYPARASTKTYQTYVRGDLNFPIDTRWDEFLAAGLAALPFDPTDPGQNPVPPLPWNPVVDPPPPPNYTAYLPVVVR